MFFKKYGDLAIGLFFLILSIAIFAASCALPPSLMGGLGSDFMPKILAIATCAISIVQIRTGLHIMRNWRGEEAAPAEEYPPEYRRVLATVGVFALYVFVLKPLGFLISSAAYLFAQMMILAPKEKRNVVLFTLIAVICSTVVYFVFRNGLSVMLPAGILG